MKIKDSEYKDIIYKNLYILFGHDAGYHKNKCKEIELSLEEQKSIFLARIDRIDYSSILWQLQTMPKFGRIDTYPDDSGVLIFSFSFIENAIKNNYLASFKRKILFMENFITQEPETKFSSLDMTFAIFDSYQDALQIFKNKNK